MAGVKGWKNSDTVVIMDMNEDVNVEN